MKKTKKLFVKLEDINMLKYALDKAYGFFIKDQGSMNCTLEELLRLYDVKNPKAIQKFCYERGVFSHDPDRSKPKDAWIYYSYPAKPDQRLAENIILGAKNETRGTPLGDDWDERGKKIKEVVEQSDALFTAMDTKECHATVVGGNKEPEVIVKEVEVVRTQMIPPSTIYIDMIKDLDDKIDKNAKEVSSVNAQIEELKKKVEVLCREGEGLLIAKNYIVEKKKSHD